MEAYREPIILGSIFIYMVLCVGIGLWAMAKTKSASDFFVAGRSLGPVVIGLAVFSSTLSGFGFVGGPGLVYSQGMSSVWMVVVSTSGYAMCFFLLAKKLRLLAELRDTVSLPDIVADRYGSETVRFLMAVVILLGVLGYLATQVLAMATVLHSILGSTELFAGISLVTCAIVSSSVLIFYSVTGGIIASVYTDLVQGIVMMAAGLLVVLAAGGVFGGGFGEASMTILREDAEAILPFGTAGVFACIAWFFMFGVGLAGQPHLVTKLMMNRRVEDTRFILPLSIGGYAVAALLWISVGVIMRAVVVGGDFPALSAPDQAAPAFLSAFAHPLLAGVVFAGLFAAIMSTADAFLNIGAAAIIHDIPKAIRGRSLNNELLWARIATVGIAAIATGFALYSYYVSGELVALLGAFGWGTFAAAIFPVVAIGLNWKRASWIAAVAAILVSIGINFGVQLAGLAIPFAMASGFIALVVSTIVFIGLSMLIKPKPMAWDIERLMDI